MTEFLLGYEAGYSSHNGMKDERIQGWQDSQNHCIPMIHYSERLKG